MKITKMQARSTQQHTFTMTITDDYGRTFTGTIEVDFSKKEVTE